ncbi:MAG: hypothetical protein ACFWTY_06210 [Shouchella clausii]
MKVLHVINSLSYGGAEKLLTEVAPSMKKKEISIDIMVLKDKDTGFKEYLHQKGIKIIESPYGLYSLLNIFFIKRYLKKYNIIHVHLFPAQYYVSLANKLSFKKNYIITTEHNTHNKRRNRKLYKPLEAYIYREFNKIICISDATKANLNTWIKSTKDKSVIVSNGVEINKYSQAKAYSKEYISDKLNSNDRLLLMVASFTSQKDHITLLRAIKMLPQNFKLILVGEGPTRVKIENQILNLDLVDRVIVLGARNDVPKLMKSCDIFVLSSFWEGFGLVAVEAMAAGKIAIASDVPGLRDVIDKEELLFKVGDFASLAEKIKYVFMNSERFHELESFCSKRAEYFSVEKMVNEYIKIYNKD